LSWLKSSPALADQNRGEEGIDMTTHRIRRSQALLYAATLAIAVLGGCNTPPERQGEQAGTLIGAVVGGIVGNQVGRGGGRDVATLAGVVAGALVGGAIGRSMDDADRLKTARALETSPTGQPTHWVNPDSGHAYTVVPTRTYTAAQGPCREYTMDTVIGGRSEKVYGTACRQGDGSWRAAN
jgi:surface antigen